MAVHEFQKQMNAGENSPKLPVIFIGHGDPMNALRDNKFSRSLNQLGKDIKSVYNPKAVLCISAHWLTRGTYINNAEKPPTIHDFGGFPQELFDVQYPAPGAPQFAQTTKDSLNKGELTTDWGLDHGAWTVLKHVFPQADVPVYQMSIDYYQSMDYHFELAANLAALREKGVLIVGSGNVVHNLQMSFQKMMEGDAKPYDWAVSFDDWVKKSIMDCNWKELGNYEKQEGGKLSVPTPDHYAPLMYTMGAAGKDEPIETLYESVEYGGISMRTFKIG